MGGMITTKTMKATKTNKMMAFITIEDLVGTVEVIVFPRDYEKIGKMLNVDDKVFVSGRISAEEDRSQQDDPWKASAHFQSRRRNCGSSLRMWKSLNAGNRNCCATIMDSEGSDSVIIYVKKEKMKKVLPASRNIKITDELLGRLYQIFGEKNVKAVEKYIENTGKMH